MDVDAPERSVATEAADLLRQVEVRAGLRIERRQHAARELTEVHVRPAQRARGGARGAPGPSLHHEREPVREHARVLGELDVGEERGFTQLPMTRAKERDVLLPPYEAEMRDLAEEARELGEIAAR